jgi:hypothetical protein
MKKEERIAKYGEAAYERYLAQRRARYKANKEEESARSKEYYEENLEQAKARVKRYSEEHPEKRIANHQEECRKGGKHYERHLEYQTTGIQGDKNKIRKKHVYKYKPYKMIIAPESQIHHEWIPKTAEYRGVALVEADQHMHGFVDVIEILAGRITLRTEEEVKEKQGS